LASMSDPTSSKGVTTDNPNLNPTGSKWVTTDILSPDFWTAGKVLVMQRQVLLV